MVLRWVDSSSTNHLDPVCIIDWTDLSHPESPWVTFSHLRHPDANLDQNHAEKSHEMTRHYVNFVPFIW